MMEFGDLLQQAEQLNADLDSASELPRVECTFPQLVEKGQRLWSRTVGSGAPPTQLPGQAAAPAADAKSGETTSADVRASMLLGAKGVSVPKTAQRLEALRTTTRTLEPLEPVGETDIHGFLKNERENAILAVIEETKKKSFATVDKLHWETMFNDWEVEKQKILQSLLGDAGSGDALLLLDLEPETSVLDSSRAGLPGSGSSLDAVELLFATRVAAYNDALVQGGVRPCLLDTLVDSAKEAFEDDGLVELWTLMSRVKEARPPVGAADVITARCDASFEAALIGAGKRHLEENFKKFLNVTIDAHLPQAKRGGVPGTVPLVKAFLNVRFANGAVPPGLEDGSVEGQPVWPFIYYCIRCGDLRAALTVAGAAPSALGDFLLYMKEFVASASEDSLLKLSPSSASKLMLTYRRSVRSSHDPFKRIVYCIIGGCDLVDNHPEVATSIDDYLWLRLSLISSASGDAPYSSSSPDALTLRQIQIQLTEEYGESHFNAAQQPLRYAQVLLLTGQFEAASAFLSRAAGGQLRAHAVHFALAVHALGLLALPVDPIQAPLLSADTGDPAPMKRLNLARLLTLYTKKFEATDPREAVHYFYFMKDMNTLQGSNLFLSCLSELALETREFDLLLGRIDAGDGVRRPGVVDKFCGVVDKFCGDVQKILTSVAEVAEDRGQLEDAVQLFDLAGDFEKVLSLYNKLLSRVVSQPGAPGSTRDRLVTMATGVASRYKRKGQAGSRTTTSTFHLLLDVATFFHEYHAAHFEAAVDVVQQLKILPFSSEKVEEKVNAFKSLTEEMRRNLPDILLAVMISLHQNYKRIKSGGGAAAAAAAAAGKRGGEDGGKEAVLNLIRTRAKAMITFAGMLPYRLPGDTNARLVQLEVLMN